MHIRSITRWALILLVTVAALIVTLTALNNPTAQAHRLNSTIPCSGSIQACIDSATDGDTIVIAAGDYTESLTLNKAVSLTGVDSATTVLHALPNDRVLTVTVALTSSTIISGLTFTGGNMFDAGGIYAPTGTLRLINSQIVSNTYVGVNTYDAIIIGSQFLSNTLGEGLIAHHSLYALGATFINNSDDGGASVYGTTTIINSWFENNQSCCQSSLNVKDGDLALSNTTFIRNIYGGVYVENGSATVYNGYFERNGNGSALGAGVFVHDRSLAVVNSVFISNTAEYGGALLAPYSAQIIGSWFEANTAISGGAIYVFVTTTVTDTTFIGNTASDTGSAIHSGEAIISHTRFEGNTSANLGGSLAVEDLSVNDTLFISNTAIHNGGAITLMCHCNVSIANSRFTQNTAGNAGTTLGVQQIWDGTSNFRLQHLTIADIGFNPISAIEINTGTLGITDTIIANHAIAINNTGATVYEDYNLFYGNLTNTVGSVVTGGHSLTGDPKFIDPLNDNYHLSAGSAAIDHGIDVGLTTDLDGKPRDNRPDIGVYEFIWPYRWYFPIIYKQ